MINHDINSCKGQHLSDNCRSVRSPYVEVDTNQGFLGEDHHRVTRRQITDSEIQNSYVYLFVKKFPAPPPSIHTFT